MVAVSAQTARFSEGSVLLQIAVEPSGPVPPLLHAGIGGSSTPSLSVKGDSRIFGWASPVYLLPDCLPSEKRGDSYEPTTTTAAATRNAT